jgi:ribosomal-protein-alanine N-acetyltransferase
MRILTSRLLLRDFVEADRSAFLAYHADPRYRRLYDIPGGCDCRARELFDMFLAWQADQPRQNYQVSIIGRRVDRLIGCGGLRIRTADPTIAVFGIELSPSVWGRYGLAVEAVAALIGYGFDRMQLERIIGSTASANTRVEKLARWFGAVIVNSRAGPDWMSTRGWHEVDWAIDRATWTSSDYRLRRRRWNVEPQRRE